MSDCWKQDPDERPSFQQLLETMENVIAQEVNYFDFSKLDESKDYYAVQESRSEGTGCSENTFLWDLWTRLLGKRSTKLSENVQYSEPSLL